MMNLMFASPGLCHFLLRLLLVVLALYSDEIFEAYVVMLANCVIQLLFLLPIKYLNVGPKIRSSCIKHCHEAFSSPM